MNVLIFGASGGIGKWAVQYALQDGHHVTAYVRHPEKVQISSEQLTLIQGQITDKERITEALSGQDAVIWCVGVPMKRKYPVMQSLEGHKILIEAMKEQGVKRLIDWGTPSIRFEQDKNSLITVAPGILAGIAFPQAKKEMIAIGQLVQASELDWTLVRFIAPKDSSYTGNVKTGFGDVKMNLSISRKDIGAFMVKQLHDDRFIRSMPIIGS